MIANEKGKWEGILYSTGGYGIRHVSREFRFWFVKITQV